MHARLVSDIESIRREVLSEANPYKLSPQEKKDLTIVSNTMIYIAQNIGDDSSALVRNLNVQNPTLFYAASANMEDYAIIHLDEFRHTKAGEERKKYVEGSLPKFFVECFKDVKEAEIESKKPHVKEFISKMQANCIDARTREAFNYAKSLGKEPKLLKVVEGCSNELVTSGAEVTYFRLFKQILTKRWGSKYSGDPTAQDEAAKKGGVIDATTHSLIKDIFGTVAPEPKHDFIKLYTDLPANLLPAYFQFVSLHPDLIAELDAKLQTPDERHDFNQFMIIGGIHAGKIDQLEAYINASSPRDLLNIWGRYLSADVIERLNTDNQVKLYNLFLERIKSDKDLFRMFIKSKRIGESETLVEQVIELDSAKLMRLLLQQKPPVVDEEEIYRLTLGERERSAIGYELIKDKPRGMIDYFDRYIVNSNISFHAYNYGADLIFEFQKNGGKVLDFLREIDSDRLDHIKEPFYVNLLSAFIKQNTSADIIIGMLNLYPRLIELRMGSLMPYAALSNQPELMAKLIGKKGYSSLKVGIREFNVVTAARANSWDVVRVLIKDEKKEGDFPGISGTFFYAVKAGQRELAFELLKRMSLASVRTGVEDEKLLAIHFAVIHNDIELADKIFQRSSKTYTREDKSIWVVAAENPEVNDATVKWIVDHCSNIFHWKFGGKSFLAIARENNHPAIQKLVTEKVDLIANILIKEISTGISITNSVVGILTEIYKWKGQFKELLLLLKQNYPGSEPYNELITAFLKLNAEAMIKNGDIELLTFLINENPLVISAEINDEQQTLLHLAASLDKPDSVQALIGKGADVNVPDKNGFDSLSLAASKQKWSVVRQLAEMKLPIPPESYAKALPFAAQHDQKEIALLLLNKIPPSEMLFESIHSAIRNNDLKLAQALYDKMPDCINYQKNFAAPTPLFTAMDPDVKIETVQWLMGQKNIDPSLTWNEQSVVDYAINNKQFGKLLVLVKNDVATLVAIALARTEEADNNADDIPDIIPDTIGLLVGIAATLYKTTKNLSVFVKEFIGLYSSEGQKIFFTQLLDRIAEHAIVNNDIQSIIDLKPFYPGVLNLALAEGTLLHQAARLGSASAVTALLSTDIDATAKNARDQTPILVAALEKKWDVVDMFIERKAFGADKDKVFYKAVQSSEIGEDAPLATASKLLAVGINPTYSERDEDKGNMPLLSLHHAILVNNRELAAAILEKHKEIKINTKAAGLGPTPLDVAVRSVRVNNDTLAWLLKQKGVDLSQAYQGVLPLQALHQIRRRKLLKDDPFVGILQIQLRNKDINSAAELFYERLKEEKSIRNLFRGLEATRKEFSAEFNDLIGVLFNKHIDHLPDEARKDIILTILAIVPFIQNTNLVLLRPEMLTLMQANLPLIVEKINANKPAIVLDAFNKIYELVKESKDANKDLLEDIRMYALAALKEKTKELGPQEAKALLQSAKAQPVFKDPRNTDRLGKLATLTQTAGQKLTVEQKLIDAMIKDIDNVHKVSKVGVFATKADLPKETPAVKKRLDR